MSLVALSFPFKIENSGRWMREGITAPSVFNYGLEPVAA
jgi:hypothetical protein